MAKDKVVKEFKAERDEKGRLKKGSCLNPTGRAPVNQHIKDLLIEAVPTAIQTLLDIIIDDTAKQSDKVSASKIIIDKVVGSQHIIEMDTTVTGKIEYVIKPIGFMDEEEGDK